MQLEANVMKFAETVQTELHRLRGVSQPLGAYQQTAPPPAWVGKVDPQQLARTQATLAVENMDVDAAARLAATLLNR